MAKVLRNFLIGIGLDTSNYDEGAKRVEGSLGRMRTLVGFTGSAIAGAFTLAGAAAVNAGGRVDQFNLSVEKLNTSPDFIYAYGRALESMGGDAEDAVAAINSAENALAQLRLKGEFGSFQEAAFAGVDTHALMQAQTGEDFIRALAEVVPQMDKDQQRLIQDAWGLSDGVMRSLRAGSVELDAAVSRASSLYGEFGRATEAARDYNRALSEINTRFEGIGETLAVKILPGFTRVIDAAGGIIDRNRDIIEKGAEYLGENPVATSLAAGGGATAGVGVALRGLMPGGIGAAGARLARFGTWGAAAGAGLMAGDIALNGLSDEQRQRLDEEGPLVRFAPEGRRDPSDFLLDYMDRKKSEEPSESSEPVYSGGEVSHSEALNASPEVIMLRDQREKADKPVAPQRVNVQNQLDVRMEIDGRALDSRVVEVVERREREAAEDIISAVDR